MSNLQDEIHARAAVNRTMMVEGDNPLVATPGTGEADEPSELLDDDQLRGRQPLNTDPTDEQFYADYDNKQQALIGSGEGTVKGAVKGADNAGSGEPNAPGTETVDFRDQTVADLKAGLDDGSVEGYDKGWHKADYVRASLERLTVADLKARAKAADPHRPVSEINALKKDELVELLAGEKSVTPAPDEQ